jgi:hypothetical protein
MRKIAPRILHHLDQLDPIILDHRAVDLDHLFGRQVGHVGDFLQSKNGFNSGSPK